MFKRLVSFHLCVCLLFLGLLGKIAYVGTDRTYSAAATNNTVALTLDQRHGAFYDRNGVSLTNTQTQYMAILRPTEKVIAALDSLFTKEEIESILKRLQAGKPILQKVPASARSTDEIPIITVSNRYSSPQLLAHLIGDASSDETIRSGLEKSFYDFLNTDASMKIKYHVDAQGRMLQGDLGQIITHNYDSKRGVQLTIDQKIQAICEQAVDEATNFKKGAVVVLDVQTSEIRAMLSRPNIDLNHLAASMASADSPFLNRALSAYTVGSVFKLAVASVALENGLSGFTHNCTGSIQIGSLTFNCHKLEGHGNMDFENAIGQSCNPYFIALGQQLGGTLLLNRATDFGFGQSAELANGLISAAGTLPTIREVNERGNLANFSFGQGALTATPLQIANMIACIANDGVYHTPSLVLKQLGDKGEVLDEQAPSGGKEVIDTNTAKQIQQYMISVVESGSGRIAAPSQGGAGGKTATAETGWMKESGEEVLHVWFAGFYPAETPKYAIVVMNEDGNSGAIDCGPIFKQIADGIAGLDLT